MGAQVGPSTSVVPRSTAAEDSASVYRHGAVTGLIGAAIVALWFLFLDFSRGQLLYTPTVLGTILFRGGQGLAAPGVLAPSLTMTLMFTLVHGAVFIVIGIAAARLLDMFEHRPNLLLAVVLLFVILGLGFLAFAMSFAAYGVEVMSWFDILFGNLLAAAAMAAHLWRARPHHEAVTRLA